jgi:hypothetical protein
MGLLDFFRRPPPIRDANALAGFIDYHAAFVAQKGVYEYARARAGHYSKVLFKEPEFQQAANVSRWQTFPLGLAMVGEVVEGIVLPAWPGDRQSLSAAMRRVVLGVFDRYPAPPMLPPGLWPELRDELDRHLALASLHPPKMVKDIPEPFWERYFSLMPIHKELLTKDAPTTRGYLAVTLINIHGELTRRIDLLSVVRDLGADGVAAG